LGSGQKRQIRREMPLDQNSQKALLSSNKGAILPCFCMSSKFAAGRLNCF
jgi:hypothetical protein